MINLEIINWVYMQWWDWFWLCWLSCQLWSI